MNRRNRVVFRDLSTVIGSMIALNFWAFRPAQI
jgi:hypothetical protein